MQVEIYHNNETGKWLWAVQIIGTDEWIDAFLTKEEAINFCLENNLNIKER